MVGGGKPAYLPGRQGSYRKRGYMPQLQGHRESLAQAKLRHFFHQLYVSNTWSKCPVSISGTSYNYDFTISDTLAYGNNLKLLATGKYGVYAGDVNADGNIDETDVNLAKNSSSVFTSGYITYDMNGDGSVDALDLIMVDHKAATFFGTMKPL